MILHLKADRPLLYLSGTGTYGMTEKDIIKQGAKYRCYSYAYVAKEGFYYQRKIAEAMDISIKNKLGIMMDSSAHSFHRLNRAGLRKASGKWNVRDVDSLRDAVIKSYADYVKVNTKKWDWYVNFDYVRECEKIYAMQKKLEGQGIKPVPVFHGDQSTEWLERYCKEGHKLVCIGTVSGRKKYIRMYYDRCFDMAEKYGVLLHGLAVTSLSLMYGYDWYSVDSATWAKVAAYGCILCTSESIDDSFGYIHVTDRRHGQGRGIEYMDLDKKQQQRIKDVVHAAGFNMKSIITDGAQRSLYNIYVFSHKIQHLKQDIADSRVRWQSLLDS